MSRKIHQAPFAVASDGTVLLNVLEMDAHESLEELVATAAAQRGATFVGVKMNPTEVRKTLEELRHGVREAAAWRGGKRLARKRKDNRRHRVK